MEVGRQAVTREHATDVGLDVSQAIRTGFPHVEILEYAERNDIDHTVMGSHGRNEDSSLLLGSVAETVVRRSPVLVTVVR